MKKETQESDQSCIELIQIKPVRVFERDGKGQQPFHHVWDEGEASVSGISKDKTTPVDIKDTCVGDDHRLLALSPLSVRIMMNN